MIWELLLGDWNAAVTGAALVLVLQAGYREASGLIPCSAIFLDGMLFPSVLELQNLCSNGLN